MDAARLESKGKRARRLMAGYTLLYAVSTLLLLSSDAGPDRGSAALFVDLLTAVAGIGAAAAFLAWFHQAAKNCRETDQEYPNYGSPAWAVVWWLLPIANLIVPYYIALWILRESGKNEEEHSPEAERTLGWWWAAWVGSHLTGTIAALNAATMATAEETTNAGWAMALDAVSAVLLGIALALVLKVMREVERRQADDGEPWLMLV